MATKTFRFPMDPGETITAKAYHESDLSTVVNGAGSGNSCTEASAGGLYTFQVTEAMSGRYYVALEAGGEVIGSGWVDAEETTDTKDLRATYAPDASGVTYSDADRFNRSNFDRT